MIPLAVSGPLVIGTAASGTVVLLLILLRLETRGEARERAEAAARDEAGGDRR
jgi:hypothetical protein